MKKFEFTLSKMKSYQEQVLQRERNAMAELNAEKNKAEMWMEEIKRQLEDVHSEKERVIKKGTTIFKLNRYTATISNGNSQIEDIKRRIKILEMEIEKQRLIVVEASKEVSKLEKLEAQQREDYRQNLAKEEMENVLEYVSGKFVREGVS